MTQPLLNQYIRWVTLLLSMVTCIYSERILKLKFQSINGVICWIFFNVTIHFPKVFFSILIGNGFHYLPFYSFILFPKVLFLNVIILNMKNTVAVTRKNGLMWFRTFSWVLILIPRNGIATVLLKNHVCPLFLAFVSVRFYTSILTYSDNKIIKLFDNFHYQDHLYNFTILLKYC